MPPTPIYLDANSTTPLRPEAWEAMRPALTDAYGNPASAHTHGRQARRYLEESRELVASLLGAHPEEVVFTSGATEANNLALFGLAGSWAQPTHVVTSLLEHPCVVEPARQLAARSHNVTWLPATSAGVIDADTLLAAVTPATKLVALMLVNGETGCVQPVAEVARRLPAGVAFHCDAAQAVAKMPVNFKALGVTTMSVSGHKFGGPKGVGVLVVKHGTALKAQLFGGHQQRGQRPGTEPVALAVGLATALEISLRDLAADHAHRAELKRRFLGALRSQVPALVVNGDGLPTTLNVSFPGCRADLLLMSLDLAGVSCSTGSACSSGSLLPSPVLQAMGVPDGVLRSALRFSFAATLTDDEIDDGARRVVAAVAAVCGSAAGASC